MIHILATQIEVGKLPVKQIVMNIRVLSFEVTYEHHQHIYIVTYGSIDVL